MQIHFENEITIFVLNNTNEEKPDYKCWISIGDLFFKLFEGIADEIITYKDLKPKTKKKQKVNNSISESILNNIKLIPLEDGIKIIENISSLNLPNTKIEKIMNILQPYLQKDDENSEKEL